MHIKNRPQGIFIPLSLLYFGIVFCCQCSGCWLLPSVLRRPFNYTIIYFRSDCQSQNKIFLFWNSENRKSRRDLGSFSLWGYSVTLLSACVYNILYFVFCQVQIYFLETGKEKPPFLAALLHLINIQDIVFFSFI